MKGGCELVVSMSVIGVMDQDVLFTVVLEVRERGKIIFQGKI